ncbi:cytidine deaminase-like protein [Aspergillus karnatakaensis]|uniref:nucleoside deaminase n=1 Tax=Aspergillus karnatakaensis TaxID=1810916 RepID=UPI003CCD777B
MYLGKMFRSSCLSFLSFLLPLSQAVHHATPHPQLTVRTPHFDSNITIPKSTREYWMRQTQQALLDSPSPCPFAAFATVIVNHTGDNGLGDLICTGVNSGTRTGTQILHGEIAAILNCSDVLQDPTGRFQLTPAETLAAFTDLSLYTNAESCPMCASAVRWTGFKEYIYGTSIDALVDYGWGQIHLSSAEVFAASGDLPSSTFLIGDVLSNETDPYFAWQFDDTVSCPVGCERRNGRCRAAR